LVELEFSTVEVHEKFFNESGDFIEIELRLPKLVGDFAGIPLINEFFAGRLEYFYNEIDVSGNLQMFHEWREQGADSNAEIVPIRGLERNWGRVAQYELGSVHGDVISIYAWRWGGMGGVTWLGKEGHTFDLNTGERLELSDIFSVSEEEYMNLIFDFITQELAVDGRLPFSPFAPYTDPWYEIIRQLDPNNFYITKNSLIIFYWRGTFAPGAGGMYPNIFEIPLDDIRDILAI